MTSATPQGKNGTQLRLLGGFSLHLCGAPAPLPMHSRRVLAYLALDTAHAWSCERGVLADRLWPDVTTERARGSLRTALWRIRRASDGIVTVEPDRVRLADGVEVDVHLARTAAQRLIHSDGDEGAGASLRVLGATDLLPGWDEPWLVLAREQLRQERLHALEASAARLRLCQRYADAIHEMLAVIAEEPLRESAHATLIDTYLDQGNISEAHLHLQRYDATLWRELGIRPSPQLVERVATAGLSLGRASVPTGDGATRSLAVRRPVPAP